MNYRTLSSLRTILIILTIFLTVRTASGQRSASLTGTVLDPEGAVIQAVDLQLINALTGEKFVTYSNSYGMYSFALLPNGRYHLTAEIEGFKLYSRSGLQMSTGQAARTDIHMEVCLLYTSPSPRD